ncbi:hypothetical protein CcCBS67573_g09648 [Chytriomyces confervae]|uniref:Uncharacterized protein n=1 Tax=Chytriomyces confervae TaxID=246404 RepID=A0A507DS97_9FUNG|nr:hypothetical protein CcCBS67573_g09648 [Chytriomyces confervae]
MENELNKSLDGLIGQIERSMDHIVAVAKMRDPSSSTSSSGDRINADTKDRLRVAQEHQKTMGATANIIHSAEALLSLTAGIKQQLLLNDFATLNTGIASRVSVLQTALDGDRQALSTALQRIADGSGKD